MAEGSLHPGRALRLPPRWAGVLCITTAGLLWALGCSLATLLTCSVWGVQWPLRQPNQAQAGLLLSAPGIPKFEPSLPSFLFPPLTSLSEFYLFWVGKTNHLGAWIPSFLALTRIPSLPASLLTCLAHILEF